MELLEVKEGVRLDGLSIKIRKVLIAAAKVWSDHGQTLVVTSGLDGVHSVGSLHYYGYAVDLRTRYFDKDQVLDVVNDLVNEIGCDKYTVILHKTHIHVHYNGVLDHA